jgi:HSP20 family protein
MAIEQQRKSLREKLTSDPQENRPASRALSNRPDWRDRNWGADPFSVMGRLADQMDRWFLSRPSVGGLWRSGAGAAWIPQVETFQRGNQLVVRADLPGLRKEDVTVEIADDALTIQGERRDEHEEEREGFFASERNYGSFCRVVPLPEGAIADTARAKFVDGVLEVTVEAPPRDVARGRKIEISS